MITIMTQMEREAKAALNPAIPRSIKLLGGLPPMVKAQNFQLSAVADSPPFLRIDCTDMNLAYILVDPFLVANEYAPEFSDADLNEIGIKDEEVPLILSIVNFSRGLENVTMNLIGPLLINPRTANGKQVVLLNAPKFSSRHRLVSH